jgi:scaffold protein (connect acetoacetyl-CoA thiolase and HMG-CoA synthase)
MVENREDEAVRPIRPNLFLAQGRDGRPKLLGSRCRETGELFWPAEVMNPVTRHPDTLEPAEIDGEGKIVSFTTVARGLPGFASPYVLAAIALEAGPTLIAQLDGWQGRKPAIGEEVDLVIGTIKTERDGARVIGPKFRPRTV